MASTEGSPAQSAAGKRSLEDASDGDVSTKGARTGEEAPPGHGDEVFNPQLLQMYYSKFYPYDHMFRWLSYGQDPHSSKPGVVRDYLSRREFTFTMENDIYIRYLSFKDKDDMRKHIMAKQPHKIDIGAVFSAPPSKHTTMKKEAFFTVERELVFDIDLTDYDDVRTCCSGATICRKCWQFMTAALKVMDIALRNDFGFQHIVWVYSGRRGIHAWVCDDTARALSNDARTAVVDYLTANVGSSDQVSDKLSGITVTNPLHPSHERALNILEPLFVDITASDEGQGFLGENSEHWEKVLELVPDEGTLHATLREVWADASDARQRWRQLKSLVAQAQEVAAKDRGPGTWRRKDALAKCVAGIVFYFLYPRLDANVSKQQNHLLKSPFCVHPKTGRVCVPVDPRTADAFDPFAVPTIPTLMNDAAEFDAEAGSSAAGGVVGEEWGKTSLKPYLDYFSTWLLPMEAKTKQVQRKKAARAAAASGDW